MSRYKAYPEYKSSGVDNLGAIPCAWEVMQLKRSVLDCVNGIWGSEPENDGNDTVVIRVADFDRPRLSIVDDGFTHRKIDPKEKRSRLLKRGDLLLEKSGGGEKTLVGQVVLFEKYFAAVTSNFVAKMTPHPSFSGSYLNYVFSRFYSGNINYCSIKQNTGIQNLDSASYLSEKFGFPPLPEQEKIASFLDHETAKIDALIEKQQRLIELLKEKRQAVISHAVTKGLNPNAPMKDSGVEWHGEVPAHWDVLKLGYLMKLKGGAGFPDSYQGQEGHEIPFYKVGDLARANSESCLTEPLHTVTYETAKELRATIFNTGSIVFAKVGAALLLKRFCTLNKPSCIDNNMMGAEIRSIELREFLLFVMPLLDFELIVNPGAVPSVNGEQITSILIALPPQDEQIEIVDFLKTSRIKFDHLIRNAEQAICLFQERRTALISAAVTGKIDVRDWQAAA